MADYQQLPVQGLHKDAKFSVSDFLRVWAGPGLLMSIAYVVSAAGDVIQDVCSRAGAGVHSRTRALCMHGVRCATAWRCRGRCSRRPPPPPSS